MSPIIGERVSLSAGVMIPVCEDVTDPSSQLDMPPYALKPEASTIRFTELNCGGLDEVAMGSSLKERLGRRGGNVWSYREDTL
jgi:hypothetical protein